MTSRGRCRSGAGDGQVASAARISPAPQQGRSSWLETAHPTDGRRRFCRSSKWCAALPGELGDAETEVARKLEKGLDVARSAFAGECRLVANLLGLKPPDGALAGLDGVLIGLRTRDLLHRLLQARCRLSQVVMMIEDLHWVDSVSQEVLEAITEGNAKLHLVIFHTRRPEYEPPWRDRALVTTLQLTPLRTGDVRRLVASRLGADTLPEALVQQVTEKAEGNALFAEEILSFLVERGVLRSTAGKVEFDGDAVAGALPASLQNLLTARVDRLAPKDRSLLQAASVIGRRFDAQLLAAVTDNAGDIKARLAGMQRLDLIRSEGTSQEYAFKHALVRDALYQSLLKEPRTQLHVKIAEEIERRSGNRLTEVVETLAYHYALTDRTAKAFAFLAMAAEKSLGVYSLDDADKYFAAAITLLDAHADCASDEQVAEFLVGYAAFSHLMMRLTATRETVERFTPRLQSPPGSSQLHVDPTPLCIGSARVGSVSGSRTGASAPVRCRGPEPRPAITRLRPCQRHSCFDAHHALSGRRLRSCQP